MPERWRAIEEHEGYEVSDRGRVRNAAGHVLALQRHSKGYLTVMLGRRGGRHYVHRLVCRAFNGPPPASGVYHADHIDFTRDNNVPTNLRWLASHLNDWRWKGYEDVVDEDEYVMSAEESAALDRRLEAAGW
jgi:hypothetical protein